MKILDDIVHLFGTVGVQYSEPCSFQTCNDAAGCGGLLSLSEASHSLILIRLVRKLIKSNGTISNKRKNFCDLHLIRLY